MKKLIIALLAATTVFAFASCGSEECALCGEGGADNEYEGEYLCDDCYDGMEALASLADLDF